MLASIIVSIVDFAIRRAWLVVAFAAALAAVAGTYSARNFAMTTDIGKLISPDLSWRKREETLNKAFPRVELITIVVEAPTPELVDAATASLTEALKQRGDRFRSVDRPGGGVFFARNGLLFQPHDELKKITAQLASAEPLIHDLAADPSLRGLADGLTNGLMGVQTGKITLDSMARPMNAAADTIDDILAGKPASFSFRTLVQGQPAGPADLRRFIEVWPHLDFSALEPGRDATDLVRKIARDLDLAGKYQANVRLTGPVPIADEEFGTLKENALLNALVTIAVVLVILWLALKSKRIILAVFINLVVGLAITAALGLMMVGSLNLISVSFAVLFVGLGVDFGIQFSVRYRSERYETSDLKQALLDTGRYAGAPLTLAAAAVACGFLSFLPTPYRGVSELGLIAGVGMVVAFLTSITLLPALLYLFNPPGEPEPLGYAAMAPVDRFTERFRTPILIATAIAVIGGLPLLYWLRFDFDPINLRSPKVESIATLKALSDDPLVNTNAVQIVAPSLEAARAAAKKVASLPQVARVLTLDTFIPDAQDEKLPLIKEAARALDGALNPKEPSAAPSDAENVEALKDEADRLREISKDQSGAGAKAALRLAEALDKLANGDPAARAKADRAMVEPLKASLASLKALLHPEKITLANLPEELARAWRTPDGRARVEILPKDDVKSDQQLREFTRSILAVEPAAIGGAVSILKAGDTIINAFIEAGGWALLSIAILLWIVLRRFSDVLLTLIPLLVAGIVTLELCVILDLPMNFANIIALPLLLGVGVAFKIYYVMAWRAGQTNLLQSSLTRAVVFSAMTTATAFGSLWFSSHPGTSSMGKLLALSLLCTMMAAVLFQPILMGPPRERSDNEPSEAKASR
jgi:hopanoid biosynthesis associated RND transporter like protein HpnN